MATKSLGRVSIVPQGDYDENQVYKRLDLVKDSGKTYLSLKEDNTSLLEDEDSWMLLTESGRFEDLTPQQLANLKGDKGDSFVYADFTPEQLANLKGDKGDPFVYEDFTSEQLEALLQPLNESIEDANQAAEAANTAAENALTGISGEATETNSPEPTGFHRYIITEPITTGSAWGIEVTQAELNDNWVFFNVNDGVITKELKPIQTGRGITSVSKTGTAGEVDTYTITFSDATTSTFSVTNGTNAKLPLYSAIKSANIPAGTQFIDDENGNIQYRVKAGQTLLTTELPANVIGTKVEQIGADQWANRSIGEFSNTGKYYNNDGVLLTNAGYSSTALYFVREGMKIKNPYKGGVGVPQAVFFKPDGTFDSFVTGLDEIVVPAGVQKIGFTRTAASTEPVKVQTDFWAEQVKGEIGVQLEDVNKKLIDVIWASKSVDNFSNTGKYYLSTNGALATNANYNASPLYRAKEGMKFKNTLMQGNPIAQAVFFRADNTFISGTVTSSEITAPAQTAFVGFTALAASPQPIKVQSDFWAEQVKPIGAVTDTNASAVSGLEVYKGVNKLSNELNISYLFPTGSENGNEAYTLENAITKLTAEQAKVGLKITFRTSATNIETYQLVGTSGSPYYLNPANYVRLYKNKDIEILTNDINLTALYGGARYTLATAVPMVKSEFGKIGLKITFRTVTGSANAVETWQLVGNYAGSYPTFYNNPDNYVRVPIRTEIMSWINEINISTLFPTGGTVGDFRYTLSGAIAKIPTEFVKVGLKVTFRTDLGETTQTWVLVKNTLGGYSSYHLNPDNYERVPERFEFDKLKNDYNSNTNNRLANLLFESRETWNTKNPTNQIESLTIMTNNPATGNYRIPCSIITNAGTILAASELRPIDSPGDYGDFSIELYRKTTGGTATNTILLPFNYAGLGRFMDPSFVIDRTGAHGPAGRIYLFAGSFQKRDIWDTNSTAESDYIYITSDDDGVTWSTHTSVKSKWDLSNYKLAMPAPNNGIQLANGSFVIPSFSNRGAMILVKEVGQDWHFSKEVFGPDGSGRIDECTVVERADNEIVLIGRNNKNYADYPHRGDRVFKYDKPSNGWIIEESTFSVNRSNQLSACKAVIGGRTLYLKTFTDSNTTDRRNITLWASVDLKTWIRIYRIYAPGGNGYTSINYYNNRLIVSHETAYNILFQELTPLLGLITDSITTNLESNISVQDRMQMIINMIKGI